MSRRPLAILLVLVVAGCGAPQAGVTIEGGSGGVRVAPSVSGNLGGLSVSVRG